MPLPAVLSFLKETRSAPGWALGEMAATLKIGTDQAKQLIETLKLQGYVNPDDGNWVTNTAGEAVAGTESPRLTGAAIESALDEMRSRIAAANRDPKTPFRVVKAVAFGDFRDKRTRVQPAVAGLELDPRKESGHQNAGDEEAFLTSLRKRSAMLNLRPFEDWMARRTHLDMLG